MSRTLIREAKVGTRIWKFSRWKSSSSWIWIILIFIPRSYVCLILTFNALLSKNFHILICIFNFAPFCTPKFVHLDLNDLICKTGIFIYFWQFHNKKIAMLQCSSHMLFGKTKSFIHYVCTMYIRSRWRLKTGFFCICMCRYFNFSLFSFKLLITFGMLHKNKEF